MTVVPVLVALCAASAVLCGIVGVVGTAGTPRPTERSRWLVTLARIGWRSVVVAVVVGLAVGAVTGWPVAGLAAGVSVVAVPRVLQRRDTRSAIARLEALATWTRRIADILGSGANGLESAITTSARTAPEPLANAVQALASRIPAYGLEPALRGFADDLHDPAADEIVMALILRSRAGGRGLLDVLADQANTLTATVAARREIDAERDKPRATIRAMLWITAAVIGGALIFGGNYLSPLNTLLGQLVLATACAISATGIWWMHTLCRPPRHNRLLTPTRPPGTRLPRRSGSLPQRGGA